MQVRQHWLTLHLLGSLAYTVLLYRACFDELVLLAMAAHSQEVLRT
jgi:hypothetical protein